MSTIAFVDTETTHLNAEIGEAWEVAVILREHDGNALADTEYVWQVRPNLIGADPESLRIGRYRDRFAVPPGAEAAFTAHESGHITPMSRAEVVTAITNVLSDAVLIGSNPAFDDRFLRKLLGSARAGWHYRPIDVATLVAGHLLGLAHTVRKFGGDPGADAPTLPFSSRAMSRAMGVEPPGDDVAHTALGDARWVRDVFNAVTGGAA